MDKLQQLHLSELRALSCTYDADRAVAHQHIGAALAEGSGRQLITLPVERQRRSLLFTVSNQQLAQEQYSAARAVSERLMQVASEGPWMYTVSRRCTLREENRNAQQVMRC